MILPKEPVLVFNRTTGTMWSWRSQAEQYPAKHIPGIHYQRGEVPEVREGGYVDCLLSYNTRGDLVGVLNHYPMDLPPHERKGNVNVWVHPDHRGRLVATGLLDEADHRWNIDLGQQIYSHDGIAFVRHYTVRRFGVGIRARTMTVEDVFDMKQRERLPGGEHGNDGASEAADGA